MFKNCRTPQEVKSLYRQLAKENHPDLGGEKVVMQAINAAYEAALKRMDGHTSVDSDGQEHTYRYNSETERKVMEKLAEILKVAKAGWTVEIVGVWIWVSDTEREDKDLLNKNGCGLRWHNKRSRWYFKPYSGRTRYSKKSFGDLKEMYGSREVETTGASAVR